MLASAGENTARNMDTREEQVVIPNSVPSQDGRVERRQTEDNDMSESSLSS